MVWLTEKNTNKTHYLIFKTPSKNELSLELNIWRVSIKKTQFTKFLGTTFTPHLKWNEYCKDLVRRANSRQFQLWKLSNLNVNKENIIFVYKSWIRPLFLYSKACSLDLSHAVFNKIVNLQNRARRICLCKLHKEANMKSFMELQVKFVNGIIKKAIKDNILSYQSW